MLTVKTTVNAPITMVRNARTHPSHIVHRAFASDDWCCPAAVNNLHIDGEFSTTMAAKDGSVSFDFGGMYTYIQEYQQINYTMLDGRKAEIFFEDLGNAVIITENFDPENENSLEMQQAGRQAIIDNFKKYVESIKPINDSTW